MYSFNWNTDKKIHCCSEQTEEFHFGVVGGVVMVVVVGCVFAGHQSTGGSPGNQHFNTEAEPAR